MMKASRSLADLHKIFFLYYHILLIANFPTLITLFLQIISREFCCFMIHDPIHIALVSKFDSHGITCYGI